MSLLVALLCILFLGVVLLLVVVNPGVVDVNLLWGAYRQVPVGTVMVLSLLAGIVFASFLGIIDGIRIRLQNRSLRRQVAHLEDEMEDLRHRSTGGGGESPREASPPMDYPV
jgi:uncharacterized integral membrane protein